MHRLILIQILFSVLIAKGQNISIDNLWSLGTDGRDRSWRTDFDTHGNFYITGSSDPLLNFDLQGGTYTGVNDHSAGSFIARYRADNSVHWAMHTGYSPVQLAPVMTATDSDGNLVVAGMYRGGGDVDFSDTATAFLPPSPNKYSLFFAKYDTSGVLLNHSVALSLPDSLNSFVSDRTFYSDIKVDGQNNIFVSGYSGDIIVSPGVSDTLYEFSYFLIKLDASCNILWMRSLPKVVREFHNWTNFYPFLIDIDAAGDIYMSLAFGDSLNIRFEHEPAQYIRATPYVYPGPGAESSNMDFVVIKYDNDGNYIRHRHFNTPDDSRQKQMDVVIAEGHRIIILASFDKRFETPVASYASAGHDTVYGYNFVLMECDTMLNVQSSALYHNNILEPRGNFNLLHTDSCGNLFLWSDLVISDGHPFPPFYDNTIPLLSRDNIYLFDRNLSIADTIVLSNYHLSDQFDLDVSFGKIMLFGTFSYILSLHNKAVVEQNYQSSSPFYDMYLAEFSYDGCERVVEELPSKISFPNVFTPNDDQHNEVFRPKEIENVTGLKIKIYNRWGGTVFNGKENEWWNGRSGNRPCPDGVYFFIAEYLAAGKPGVQKGAVTVIR